MSASSEGGLRFVVVLERSTLSAWEASCIDRVLELGIVELVGVILAEDAQDGSFRARTLRASWRVYEDWWVKRRSRAFRESPQWFDESQVPILRLRASDGGASQHAFHKSLLGLGMDFVLSFVPWIDSTPFESARLGVLFFDGEPSLRRPASIGFFPLHEGNHLTTLDLWSVRGAEGTAKLVEQGIFRSHEYSHVKNLDRVLFAAVDWPAKFCREIDAAGEEALRAKPTKPLPIPRAAPSAAQILGSALKSLWRFTREQLRYVSLGEEWNIGVIKAPISKMALDDFAATVQWIPKRKRTGSLADPFGARAGNHLVLLAEEFEGLRRGRIVALNVSPIDVELVDRKRIDGLVPQGSYPFLFSHGEDIFCLPESFESLEVALFRADEFPHTWSKASVLVSGFPAVDATILRHEGRWWLFCTNAEGGSDSNLHIWFADDLLGPWLPHPLNPVKCDVRSARPGGTPFVVDGVVYRPAQDSSVRYGGGIVINKILALTRDHFEEEVVASLPPDPKGPYPHGLHTVSSVGDWTVIDGRRSAPFAGTFPRLKQKLMRLTSGYDASSRPGLRSNGAPSVLARSPASSD